MIVAGFDIDEIFALEQEDEAAARLGAWAKKLVAHRRREAASKGGAQP